MPVIDSFYAPPQGDKLAVWLAEAGEEKTVVQIGKMVKAAMGIDQEQTIQFNIHNEEKARYSGQNKLFV